MKKGDRVIIGTDTIFDQDGIPVSIRKGATAVVHEVEDDWCQVIVKWTDGPELLGVPTEHLSLKDSNV